MDDFDPSGVIPSLSANNLSILENQLTQEALMIRKIQHYSRQCQDSELKNLCSRLAERHKNHYNSLLSYLTSRSK